MNEFIKLLIIFLEIIFGVGLIGSFCVLILATIEDAKVLFHGNEHTEKAPATASGD